jgi:hypothetical protein
MSTRKRAKCRNAAAVRTAAAAPRGRGVEPLDDRDHGRQGGDEIGGRDRPSVDGDPFLDGMDVRREVATHAIPRLLEDGADRGDRRSLPLSARDVDDRQVAMRCADGGEKPTHPGEAEAGGPRRRHALEVDAPIEPGEHLFAGVVPAPSP